MPKRSMMIINPASAGGSTGKRVKEIERAIRVHFPDAACMLTTSKGSGVSCAIHAIAQGFDHLIIVGGDGTINEVVNGIFQDELVAPGITLTIIPAGTGGDFKRSIGLPSDTHKAISHLAQPTERLVDVGKAVLSHQSGEVFTTYFLNVASLGITTLVADSVNKRSWSKFSGGTFTYLLHALKVMHRYRNIPITITMENGEVIQANTTVLALANGRYFGGAMKIAPDAQLDDGMLDVIWLRDFSLFDLYTQNLKLYWGGHMALRKTKHWKALQVHVQGEAAVEMDGELKGYLPATFTCLPAALRLLN